ncbi:hypothetical protein MuYL_1514 [Mucilaginibacter xinganensis]|uniref:Uncharacterized protein n=1 Tax=Mucilaginibacter xinganensis TaxID=1234841 RepID=A0A223NU68_9SPHI|nr:hypothetical protein MuYL_1514 [Mucilaginibacter xinganensis]
MLSRLRNIGATDMAIFIQKMNIKKAPVNTLYFLIVIAANIQNQL